MVCNLRANRYSWCRYETTLKTMHKLRGFNSYTTNIAPIQNRRPACERASEPASLTYSSCRDTITTKILNWSDTARPARAGVLTGNQPKSNGPGCSCGKPHCNGSVQVPTLTWHCLSGLEPLLTLTETAHECTQSKLNDVCHTWYVVPDCRRPDSGAVKGWL